MHGALLEYSSPYRTVFTSYGMFSTPLRRCGRGRENGLVAIHPQRRNARPPPPPPRLASLPPGGARSSKMKKDALLPAGYAFSESSKCIHTRYQVRILRTDRPRKTGPLAVVHCHGPQWNLDSGSLPCNISVPGRVFCRPEVALPDRSATLEVVGKSRGSLHLTTTARLSPSGLKAESRNKSQLPR
jgi:hypothetical protein